MIGSVLRTYGFFVLRVIVPLAMLPILSHWLGVSDFGVALTVQSLALLGSLVVQYGFGVSGPRDLAQAQSEPDRQRVIARVLGAQIVTSLVASVLIGVAAAATPILGQSWVAIVSAVVLTLGTGLSPAWYFRGVGRAATGMGLELLGQVISFALVVVFALIRTDVVTALIAIAIGPAVSTIVAFVWMFLRTPISFQLRLREVMGSLVAGAPLFIVRASSTGFTSGAVWIVGLLSSAEQAAYFGVAAKLIGAVTSLSQPITFTMLPEISKRTGQSVSAAVSLALKWGAALVAIALGAVLGVYVLGDLLIGLLFASDMAPAIELTKMLSWVSVLVALRETQGDLVLVPLRKDRLVALIVVTGGAAGVASALLWVPENGAVGMVVARMVAEAVIVLGMAAGLLYVWRLAPSRHPAD